MKRPVDGALLMFDKGCKVFPIKQNGKTPAVTGWQEWAEHSDRKKIENYGTANPLFNWGVYCGASNLVVIDVDNKEGREGSEHFGALTSANGSLPQTLSVTTTTGGLHYYFKGDMPNSAGKIADGVDVRGVGGYVVAPFSRIKDRQYEISNNVEEIPELPIWFKKLAPEKEKVMVGQDDMVEDGSRNNTLTALAGVLRSRGAEYDSILAFLVAFNEGQVDRPLEESEVRLIARSVAKYPIDTAEAAADFVKEMDQVAIRGDSFAESDIPKRNWIMEGRYIGGFISVLIAPGGVGKSALSMLDAMSIVAGIPLTGAKVRQKGAVWIYNTEDPIDEIKRRLIAITKHHKIQSGQLSNIHISSGRDNPLLVAKEAKIGVVVNDKMIESIIKYIRKNNIVFLVADPFVRTHSVQENNNVHIDKVAWCFQRIAERTRCAICLVHHSSKGASKLDIGDMNAARGAGALVNASRIAHILTPMSLKEGEKFGVKETRRSWYVRLDNAKANLQPPAEQTNWFEKISVELINGDKIVTMEKAILLDIKEKKRKEALAAESKDLGGCLDELIQNEDTVPVVSIIRKLQKPRYNHLHIVDLSEKRAIENLIEVLSNHLVEANGAIFRYEYGGEEAHTKHLIRRDTPIIKDFL